MITIIKGEQKIICTQKTYEEQYKSLGYQIASENREATKKVASILKEKENQEKTLKDISKKPEEDSKINEKYGLKPKKGKK